MRKPRGAVASASLAVVLAACGNQAANSTTTPTPSATPYVATESGLSAVFPATTAKQTQKLNQPGINADLTLYVATTNDEQVVVGYEPLPMAPTSGEIQSRLDAGVAGWHFIDRRRRRCRAKNASRGNHGDYAAGLSGRRAPTR